jgi:hypothetical protein
MPPGPILIFDKSALQSLSLDESNWLDNFFMAVITPLFFAETLADLEKEVSKGRTPDMGATACAHHRKMLGGVLYGHELPLDGRIPRDQGQVVELGDKKGVFYAESEEEQALRRWYNHEFLDVERQIAKKWRRELSNVNHDEEYKVFQKWFLMGKPKSLAQVKTLADAYIDGSPQDGAFQFGLRFEGIPEEAQRDIFARWTAAGNPPIKEFVPYFRHVFGVDLFFSLAIACDQISRIRPQGKADNKVDIAYLYYLPFCHVFTSMDNLHKRVVPLFLRDDQTFVDAAELKADLAKLDAHYSALPDEVKATGFHGFATDPPDNTGFLTTRLWDKHLPAWREIKARKEPIDQEKSKAIIDEINRIRDIAQAAGPRSTRRLSIEETQFVEILRTPQCQKGKWLRYRKDVK